ncbi:MAG: sulfatase [Deltaproteobacteria bacterium]|nr:sulfatase [Deltaproteobacteria bacterium]MBW2150245.1 sulfatase [Deltaproteobacteria bacterium]
MNIILVIFDTLRQDHIGAYGNDWIKTPNLDAFAKESVVFTSCYADSLPTLPVRRALHTGKRVYPFRVYGYDKAKIAPAVPGWGPLPETEKTVSEILRDEGYRTAMISDCFHMFKPAGNYHRGFDTWLFVRGQELDPFKMKVELSDHILDKHLNERMKQEKHVVDCMRAMVANTTFRRSEEDYFPAMVFREASNWLFENQQADKVFMVVDSFDPHEPWDPPKYYRKMYDSDDEVADLIQSPYGHWKQCVTEKELKRLQANYAGEVSLCDRWFGHFIDTLKVTGRWEDSIVVVISDHGHNLGYEPVDKGLVSKQAYPVTRGVADLVLMIRHPSGEGAGTVNHMLLQNFDLTATLLGLIGVEMPESMEGRNFWPAVSDKSITVRDHVTIGWGAVISVITDRWWFNAGLWGEEPLLYDIRNDPKLTANIADQNPDICKQMLQLAHEDANGDIPEYLKDYRYVHGAFSLKGWCDGPFKGGALSPFWKGLIK